MKQYNLLDRITTLPLPFDLDRAATGLEHFHEAASRQSDSDELVEFARFVSGHELGSQLLQSIFGNSPFLSQCVLRDIGGFRDLLMVGPDDILKNIVFEVNDALDQNVSGTEFARTLRNCRQSFALAAAVSEFSGVWPVDTSAARISEFATNMIDAAAIYLLRGLYRSGELLDSCRSNSAEGSGLVILGMGKLGAGELNYSSDIDLIVLYDQEVVQYRGRKTAQDCFVRLTRELVKLLQDRTADGYVFRTDLRLRPDPGATPVALSMMAAENYYEALGQNWERAAMIKAAVIAGDKAAGNDFLDRLTPFVWRKNLDYAAIEDIQSIKRQMHAHRGHAAITVAGHNIKLGAGGIREIEFFAQTQQLIAGGRDPKLRVATTCGALHALAETGRIQNNVADEMEADYWFLRRLEHRLQMTRDEQTQVIPDDPDGLSHIATFSAYDSVESFSHDVEKTLRRVHKHYQALFSEAPALGGHGKLVFTGAEDDPETLKTLSELGFSQLETAAATVRKWHHGRYRATRSARAREKLTALMPALLAALGKTSQPDAALLKFDEFLAKLPAGVQLFSMFLANPGLLDLVSEILGSAPQLAETLSRRPTLLDGVISADFHDPLPPREQLSQELASVLEFCRDYQDVLDVSRRWANDRKFQVGVQVMRRVQSGWDAGRPLSDIADVLIEQLSIHTQREFASTHGEVPGGGMAVIAMGKLGGRELTPTSDLDLIFVYDFPDGVDSSDGPRPLSTSQYFSRLCQRTINALTALTPEGQLYEVDMRLRPSGSAGPLAVRLEGFQDYQSESAWTWEHMALTRARVVCGPQDLRQAIEDTIAKTLCKERDPQSLVDDVHDMRKRLAKEKPGKSLWDLKQFRGGLVDLEFISQYLQLRYAHADPSVLGANTVDAFKKLGKAGFLDEEAAGELIKATKLQADLQSIIRICTPGLFDESEAPEGLKATLASAAGESEFPALMERLETTHQRVSAYYRSMIEDLLSPRTVSA